MAIDAKLTTEEVIKELAQIAGRPTEDEDEIEKVADEDDGECGTFCLRGNRHIKELFFNIHINYVSTLRENGFLETWEIPCTLKNPLYYRWSRTGERINLC